MALPIRFSPESEETFEVVIHQLHERWGENMLQSLKRKQPKA